MRIETLVGPAVSWAEMLCHLQVMHDLALVLRPSEASHRADYPPLETVCKCLQWKCPLGFFPTLLIAVSQRLSQSMLLLSCLIILVCSRAESRRPSLATYTESLGTFNTPCGFENWPFLNLYLQPSLLWTLNSEFLTTYLMLPVECFRGISNLKCLKCTLSSPNPVLPQCPKLYKPKFLKSPRIFLIFSYPSLNSSAKILSNTFKIHPETSLDGNRTAQMFSPFNKNKLLDL